jgi:hypothetical protein
MIGAARNLDAPTPVSALLRAGVVNAGGFLLVRFADLMLTAPGVLAAVAMISGFSEASPGKDWHVRSWIRIRPRRWPAAFWHHTLRLVLPEVFLS